MNQPLHCLIIDGNNLLYSSYHVTQKMSWQMPNGTIFFFLRVLISLLKKDKYQQLLVVFDGGGISFRTNFLPDYKAQRVSMPAELWEQLGILQELLWKIKVACWQLVDWEADDLIASFVKQSQKINPTLKFDIFTRDKDLLQLIDPTTSILKYINGKVTLYTDEHFHQEYNFSAPHYVDYLSLIGDKVDNIKGIKGIGPVNSKSLIQQFQTIENIYHSLDKLPLRLKKLLENQENLVLRNKKIISLNSTISLPTEIYSNLDFSWRQWKINPQLKDFCRVNHFNNILKLLE